MPKGYYIVLGVSRGSDLKKIQKAYRMLVNKYHPDTSRSDETTGRFLEAVEAFETLADFEKRRQYDEELSGQRSGITITRLPETIRQRRTRFDLARRLSSYQDDFFSGILPGFFDVHKGRIRRKDLFFEAVLSTSEAAEGGLYPITIPVEEPCPRCSGTALWEEFLCPICSGYGQVRSEREFSLSMPPNIKDGTEIAITLEDIGLRDTRLNIIVRIDPSM